MVAEGRKNGTDVGQNGANGCKICFILESFFSKLSGIPFCFSLQWERQLNIYKKTSARFQNWRAFRFVFHCILWLILCAEYGPRGKECAPAALEAERGTTAHEAENRFWTTATPMVRTFGHGGGTAEGNWIVHWDSTLKIGIQNNWDSGYGGQLFILLRS